MLYNTIQFLLFFAVFYTVYWNIPGRYRQLTVVLGSVFFYGFFSIPFLLHFIGIILLNYLVYLKIQEKREYVRIAVILNLLNLGFFKYFYFFNKILFGITGYPFFTEISAQVRILLPLAISFYSFQMIAFAVDAGNGRLEGKKTLFDYFSFVMFFPVLIAGPIMRSSDFFPNLKSLVPDQEKTYRAGYLMISGLVKKMLVADSAALIISPVYNEPGSYDSVSLFMAGIGYTIQVYFDFSGLTDMARAVALFLGFELPENFRAPFFSATGAELWKRWHITLSNWLRDYIYFPLGGSRVSEFRSSLNLVITMTLGGIWHGADYTFLAWGIYWGIFLAVERYFLKKSGFSLPQNRLVHIVRTVFILVIFSISGLMFRSNSAESMLVLFKGIFLNHSGFLSQELAATGNSWLVFGMDLVGKDAFRMGFMKNLDSLLGMFLLFYLFHYFQEYPEKLQRFRKYDPYLLFGLGVLTIFMIATLSQGGDNFIYYQF